MADPGPRYSRMANICNSHVNHCDQAWGGRIRECFHATLFNEDVVHYAEPHCMPGEPSAAANRRLASRQYCKLSITQLTTEWPPLPLPATHTGVAGRPLHTLKRLANAGIIEAEVSSSAMFVVKTHVTHWQPLKQRHDTTIINQFKRMTWQCQAT